MFSSILTFLSQKLLLIGAMFGSLYILWLKRSESKAREDLKDARFVSVQAKAVQDQMEEMVEKADHVIQEQKRIDLLPCDRASINEWLCEQSHITCADTVSQRVPAKTLSDDTARVSKTSSKAC